MYFIAILGASSLNPKPLCEEPCLPCARESRKPSLSAELWPAGLASNGELPRQAAKRAFEDFGAITSGAYGLRV